MACLCSIASVGNIHCTLGYFDFIVMLMVWKLEGSNLCEFPDFDGYIVVK